MEQLPHAGNKTKAFTVLSNGGVRIFDADMKKLFAYELWGKCIKLISGVVAQHSVTWNFLPAGTLK